MKGETVVIKQDAVRQYYKCPKCGYQDITKTFMVCLDCRVRIKWELKREVNNGK